jgi:hypothetical protein
MLSLLDSIQMIRKEGTEHVIEMRAEFGILLPPLSASLHLRLDRGHGYNPGPLTGTNLILVSSNDLAEGDAKGFTSKRSGNQARLDCYQVVYSLSAPACHGTSHLQV